MLFSSKDIDDHCLNNNHCPKTLVCKDNTCQCLPNSFFRDSKCVKDNEETIEDFTDSSEIYQNSIPSSKNFVNIITSNRNTNEKTGNGYLNSKHEKKLQPDSRCLLNEIWYHGKCLRRQLVLGAICTASVQCIKNARCIDKQCKCETGSSGHNNKCFGIIS